MGLVAAQVALNPATLSCNVGERLICVAFSRGGATVFAVTPDAGDATWINRVAEATLPGDDGSRRSLAVAELTPTSTVTDVEFTADWSGDITEAIWLRVQEGADYQFAAMSVDDSGASSVSSQGTGTTASVPAGDVLLVAAMACRDGGTGNVTWAVTDVEPNLVGGGTVLLDQYDGVGAGGNAGAAGYLTLDEQGSATYSDTVTLPGGGAQARMTTAAIVVWVFEAAAVELSGSAASVSDATGALSVGRSLAGSAPAVGDATGALNVDRALAGSAGAVSGAEGALSVGRGLSGSAPAISDASGDLSVEGSQEVVLSGTAASVSDASGALAVARPLSGSAASVSDAHGNLNTGATFVPELAGSVTVQGLVGSSTTKGMFGSAVVHGLTGTVG